MSSSTGKESTTRTSCDSRDRGDGADGDQDGGEGGHDLWVLGGDEVQCLAGVDEPKGSLGYGGNTYCMEYISGAKYSLEGDYRIYIPLAGLEGV